MWNGSARNTNVASTLSIQAEILGSDVATAGTVHVTVMNQDGQVSNVVDFVVGAATPAPTLTAISPISVSAGGAAFPLTATGTNFLSTSKVRWNGTDRVTTFVSATQLTAAIPATDIATTGTAQVTVFNAAPGGGTSSAVSFTISSQNPVPTITSVSPLGGSVGGAAFTLTVNGTNFVSSSVVRWNGSDRTTTFVSATQVSAAIPVTDLALAGTIQITVFNPAPGGGSSSSTSFTVSASGPVQLDVIPLTMRFQATAGGSNPAAQTLRISNSGAGSLSWTAQGSTVTGGNWLSLSTASGSATAVAPSLVEVSASATGLAAGVYTGTVTVQVSGGTPLVVNVTFNVLQQAPVLVLGQTGLRLTGAPGASTTPAQSFRVVNASQGSLNWTVTTSTGSGGSWLVATPSSGTSTVGSPFPSVSVSANLAGLGPGNYYGQVRVTAAGAVNSPQTVSIVLNIPAAGNPRAEVNPVGMIFVGTGGVTAPTPQTVNVASAVSVTASVTVTASGGAWLDAQPRTLSITGGGSQALSITATPGTLTAGVYEGKVTLAFSDNTTQTVTVLFLVLSSASPADRFVTQGVTAAACVPQRLLAVSRLLGGGYSSPVGWPRSLELLAIDDCGNPALTATVVASFSNGDPPLVLVNLANGSYSGTWKPGSPAAQTALTVRVNQSGLAEATLQFSGDVAANPGVPVIGTGGVVHAASFAKFQPMAPGSIISVFGSGIADSTAGQATSLPLPTTLGGATLTIGGVAAPLYYSSASQINAQVPVELAPNSNLQVLITLNLPAFGLAAITVPESVTLDVARPGIFVTGTNQAVAIDTLGRVVDSRAPAAANDVLVVYATGLGATNPPAETGKAAPGNPPAVVTLTPIVTIGGVRADVQFAGLTPTFVGLYQLNVKVPTGVTPGSAVPIIITQAGVPSNAPTIAVR